MFSYKWNNGMQDVKATFYDGWKRLGYCKAATYKRERTSRANALLKNYKIETWYLVSYRTPIIRVKAYTNLETNKLEQVSCQINEKFWNCSNTTIHQLSKFLNELHFFHGIDLSYQEIKETMQCTRMHFFYDATIKPNYYLTRRQHAQMCNAFAGETPNYNVE